MVGGHVGWRLSRRTADRSDARERLCAAESSTAAESADQAIAEKTGFKGVDFSYDAVGVPPGQDAQKNAQQAVAKDIADRPTVLATQKQLIRDRSSQCAAA